jgi:hypothetical protein
VGGGKGRGGRRRLRNKLGTNLDRGRVIYLSFFVREIQVRVLKTGRGIQFRVLKTGREIQFRGRCLYRR